MAVDEPGDGVGRPADLIVMVVVEGIGEGDIASFFVWWRLELGYTRMLFGDLQFVIPW